MKSKSFFRTAAFISASVFLLVFISSVKGQDFKNSPDIHRGVQPKLIKPVNGSTLTNFPRRIKFEWSPIQGAKYYELLVRYNDGQWKTLKKEGCSTNTAWVEFPGDNPGDWGVRAMYEDGKPGIWSPVWGFKYKTSGAKNTGVNAGTKAKSGQK